MKEFSFEKLEVWQKARVLTIIIYEITLGFPSDEKFGLIGQMRRASIWLITAMLDGLRKSQQKRI